MTKINFQNVHTMVGADATIHGPVKLNEGIIIYGHVLGDIITEGPVRIAQGATVKGNISGSDIQVGGQVTGNMVANGLVVVGEKCIMNGDIIYKKLLIEDGAQFEGKCNLVSSN